MILGLEIARSISGIYISRKKYITDLIHDTGMADAKTVYTPLPTRLHLRINERDLFEDAY